MFAVDSAGTLSEAVEVRGIKATDWEDPSLAPCPAGGCLYIADTGDNTGERDQVVVYRVPEPEPDVASTAGAEAFPARYPEGRRTRRRSSCSPASGSSW